MSDIQPKYAGSASALTVSGLDGLSSATGTTSDAVDNGTTLYADVLIELLIANITPSGNKQLLVFALSSVDGTNYSDGQTANSGAMTLLGVLPVAGGSGPWRSAAWSLAAAFGGVVPPKWKLLIYNDAGVALAGSGNSVQYRGVTHQVN